jgi:hypothetical protein
MGAAALLGARRGAGAAHHRAAITPSFRLRTAPCGVTRGGVHLLRLVGWPAPLIAGWPVQRALRQGYRTYTAAGQTLSDALQAIPLPRWPASANFVQARPAQGDRLERCSLVVCDDDPIACPSRCTRRCALGFPSLGAPAGGGGHLPKRTPSTPSGRAETSMKSWIS